MDDFFKDLSKEQVIALKEQIERFKSLSKRKTRQIIPKDEPIFKKNTLIHGTSFNNYNINDQEIVNTLY